MLRTTKHEMKVHVKIKYKCDEYKLFLNVKNKNRSD
jgi:hypothetical protein